MKKLCLVFAVLLLICFVPNTAQAVSAFTIDYENAYDDMNESYMDGYQPTVSGNTAIVILPLVTVKTIAGNTINATSILGTAASSPFEYTNYQKSFAAETKDTDLEGTYFIVRFELPLKADRMNGVYPVTIKIQATVDDESKQPIEQSFTSYVTITDGTDPGATPPPEPDQQPVHLFIDNMNIYEGMDRSYSQGYSPAVEDGIATIILPVISDGALQFSTVTASPNLGDPASSPFVYRNYERSIPLTQNAFIGGIGGVLSYYIRFDLALVKGRINGVYPVSIKVSGLAEDGSEISETFTAYVTITDGEDAVEEPNSQPVIIVSGYNTAPLPIKAGQEFTTVITLKNTSETMHVQNMTVTVNCETEDFVLLNGTNVFYIEKLEKEKTLDIEVRYKTGLQTPAGQHKIDLAIAYDNPDAVRLFASGVVLVGIEQQMRVELEAPTIPNEVNAGDTIPLSFHVMNLGRCSVYNVRCTLEAPGFLPTGTAFIGNMDGGTAMTGDMDVFIGMKTMTEGYEGSDKYGFTSGKLILIYEDESGQEYTQEYEFTSNIGTPVINTVEIVEEEPERASQWWITVLIVAALAGILAFFFLRQRRR